MGQGHLLGRPAGAGRCQHGRDARPDVIAQQDRHRPFQGDEALRRHGHEDADGGRAGLDDQGHADTDDDAEQGDFGKPADELDEERIVPQRRHGLAHELHAQHKQAEAEEDHAGELAFLVFCEIVQHEAHEDEAHEVVRQVEGDQLGRHGGADIGAHDDAEGLLQRHEAGVDEAHGHDSRGAARLQD